MTAVSGRCGNMIDLCLDHRLLMPSQPWQLCQDDVATGPDTATTGDRIPCNWVIIIHSCSNEPQACTFHTRVKLKKQQQKMHIKTHMNNSIHKCVITLPPPPPPPPVLCLSLLITRLKWPWTAWWSWWQWSLGRWTSRRRRTSHNWNGTVGRMTKAGWSATQVMK